MQRLLALSFAIVPGPKRKRAKVAAQKGTQQ